MRSIDVQINPAIDVSDLSLGYQQRPGKTFAAVEGVNLTINNGSRLALLGESGSGKSTLAKFLTAESHRHPNKAERVKRVSGEATVLGVPLSKLSRSAQRALTAHIGFLPQDAGAKLTPDLNVGDLVFQPIEERDRKFDRSALGEYVAQMFDVLALPLSFLQKYPYELSKGQRQRVAVCQSLIHQPKLYIADEPTLGVDANNRPKIIELLEWYRNAHHPTMLLISHDINLLEAIINDVLILQNGSAVGQGSIDTIFRHAEHDYVVQLADALRANAYDDIATE